MTAQPPSPAQQPQRGLISALVLLTAICVTLVLLVVVIPAARSDPYTRPCN